MNIAERMNKQYDYIIKKTDCLCNPFFLTYILISSGLCLYLNTIAKTIATTKE